MVLLSEWAGETYRLMSLRYPWSNFIIAPIGLSFTAWITFRFFPGSERSGIPQVKTALEIKGNLAHWFPVAPASAMILLTMTAYFSGMLQSPLTSFVIVMEMTGSHEILIPLMATSFFATGTSKLINPLPLYRALCNSYIQPKKVDNA
jgi:H+/Cl- antiporter ClcA